MNDREWKFYTSPLEQGQVIQFLKYDWMELKKMLPKSVQGWLNAPSIVFVHDLPCWGRWTGGAISTIELKTSLVTNHPFYALQEVFRHEVAHQFTDVIFSGMDSAPHGEHFRQICQLIGANSAASGDYPLLDQRVFDENCEPDKVTEKIQKLLALSESPNRFEAESALKKAHELASRHEIEIADGKVKTQEEFCAIAVTTVTMRRDVFEKVLANFVEDFYHVIAIWCAEPMGEQGKVGYALYLFGSDTAVKIASFVCDFIRHFVKKAFKEDKEQCISGSRDQRDYAIGVVMGLRETLEKQVHADLEKGLILKNRDEKMQAAFERHFPRIRKKRNRGVSMKKEAVEKGRADGRELAIPDAIEKQPQSIQRLIR